MQTTDSYIAQSAQIIVDGIRADFSSDTDQAQQAEPLAYRIAVASDHLRTRGDNVFHSGYAGVVEATGVVMGRAKYEEKLADALHAISAATR